VFCGRLRRAVPGPLAHEDHEALDAEPLARRIRDRNVPQMRRGERAPVEHYSHSSTSSPPSTPPPARTPPPRRIASTPASGGGEPVTRKPPSVRKMRNRRRSDPGL